MLALAAQPVRPILEGLIQSVKWTRVGKRMHSNSRDVRVIGLYMIGKAWERLGPFLRCRSRTSTWRTPSAARRRPWRSVRRQRRSSRRWTWCSKSSEGDQRNTGSADATARSQCCALTETEAACVGSDTTDSIQFGPVEKGGEKKCGLRIRINTDRTLHKSRWYVTLQLWVIQDKVH